MVFYKEGNAIKLHQGKKDGEHKLRSVTILNKELKAHLTDEVTFGRELQGVKERCMHTSRVRILHAKGEATYKARKKGLKLFEEV